MRSPTQRELTPTQATGYVTRAVATPVASIAPLTGGGYAAVWRAVLADDRQVVLKVAPPPGARLLRYERDLISAEAEYFSLVRSAAPVPEVLAHDDEWLVTSYRPGTALTGLPPAEADPVRAELGAAMARVHAITGDRFGYPGDRVSAPTWSAAFAAMVDNLLADAADFRVDLPWPAPRVAALVARHADRLDQVTRPALLHFDLWDGNVLGAGGRLTGLVDGERYLYGDPLLDFVSPLIYGRIEDEPAHPFRRGYGPVDLDPVRVGLYRLHLYLLMLVEAPSRGMTGDTVAHRSAALAAQLSAVDGL